MILDISFTAPFIKTTSVREVQYSVQGYVAQTRRCLLLSSPHLITVYITFQGGNWMETVTFKMKIYSHNSNCSQLKKSDKTDIEPGFIAYYLETIYQFSSKYCPSQLHWIGLEDWQAGLV